MPKLSQKYVASNIFVYKSTHPCKIIMHVAIVNIIILTRQTVYQDQMYSTQKIGVLLQCQKTLKSI